MIDFRDLAYNELPQIAALDAVCNRSPWALFDYQQSFANPAHSLWGIYRDNILLGCCLFSVVIDEAEILQIFIRHESQRQGYGKQLLENVLQKLDALSVEQVFLEVMVGNTPAYNLYTKLGFNVIGTRKNYYHVDGKSIDALLMARQK